ncbi:MAG: hypothetical protein DCF22_21725 [Leptolyngbya sp.]|nr:MAG: hypothetical protein DCF22_21725 [Leptolyngbya sp.]
MHIKILAHNNGDDNFFSAKPLPSLTDLADWIFLFLKVQDSKEQAKLLISLWLSTRLSWQNFLTLITLSPQSERGGKA